MIQDAFEQTSWWFSCWAMFSAMLLFLGAILWVMNTDLSCSSLKLFLRPLKLPVVSFNKLWPLCKYRTRSYENHWHVIHAHMDHVYIVMIILFHIYCNMKLKCYQWCKKQGFNSQIKAADLPFCPVHSSISLVDLITQHHKHTHKNSFRNYLNGWHPHVTHLL